MRGAAREGYGQDGTPEAPAEPGLADDAGGSCEPEVTDEPELAPESGLADEAEQSDDAGRSGEGSAGSANDDTTPGSARARRFRPGASNPSVAMFRRPKRPRFRRSSDVLMEPKQRGRLRAAAIAAEYATGHGEDSEEEASRNVLIRLGRISLGTVVILAGIIMLMAPGPGALAIAAGLAILSKDVAWADRALHYIREKVPGVPADGSIPRSTWLVMGLLTASGIAVGIYLKTGV